MLVRQRWFRVGATVAFTFGGLLVYWGFRVYTDVPALTFLLAATWLFLRYVEENDVRLLLFSGAFMGLAFLTRFPVAAMVFAFLPFLLLWRQWRGLVVYVAGGLAAVAPWMMVNLVRYGDPFWDFFAQASVIGAYTSWQPIGLFFGHLWSSMGVLLLFLLGFVWVVRRWEKKRSVVGALLLVGVLLGVFVPLKLERYLLVVVPFCLLACVVGAEAVFFLVKVRRWRIAAAFVIVLVTVVQLVLGFSAASQQLSWQQGCYTDGATVQAIRYAEENVPAGELVISNAWTWYGFYGNHRARSTWSDNISEVLHEDDASWLFVHSHFGLDPSNLTFNGSLVTSFRGECDGTVDVYRVQK